MNDAVVISTARTSIGKAYRGALNNIQSPTMLAYAIRHAVQIMVDGMQVCVAAGGQENISAVQAPYVEWASKEEGENVLRYAAHANMPMLQTAEYVSKKYKVSRDSHDEYALLSQQRTAAA